MTNLSNLESSLPEVGWIDKFRSEHTMEALPPEARGAFSDLLINAQGARDYYRKRESGIPDNKFIENIGKNGDSPRKQLLHEIGNARLRAESMQTGVLPEWNYALAKPEDHEVLERLDRESLISALDDSIVQIYNASMDKANLDRTIKLPYGKETTGLNSLWSVTEHKILHLGMLITAADCIGGVTRPQSVSSFWG